MKAPPKLMGTVFTGDEKEKARKEGSLLCISMMTDPVCNLDCPDCFIGEKKLTGTELGLDERKNILEQARGLGARTLRIAGEGEPFCDEKIWATIDYAARLGMDAFVFTNGTKINRDVAARMGAYGNLSLALKFSGPPEFMERMTGSKGFFTNDKFVEHDGMRIPIYLKNLMDMGLNATDGEGNSRLGIEFLLRRSNYVYAVPIFEWCRRNGVIPYFEQNLEAGNALEWGAYPLERVPDRDALLLSKKLLGIDKTKFGFTWKCGIPFLVGGIGEEGGGCRRFTYNLVISSKGDAYPCSSAYFSLGNSRQKTLKQMLSHQTRSELLRNPDYRCLCRVYQKTKIGKEVLTPRDLDRTKDYSLAEME